MPKINNILLTALILSSCSTSTVMFPEEEALITKLVKALGLCNANVHTTVQDIKECYAQAYNTVLQAPLTSLSDEAFKEQLIGLQRAAADNIKVLNAQLHQQEKYATTDSSTTDNSELRANINKEKNLIAALERELQTTLVAMLIASDRPGDGSGRYVDHLG